tara:strand:- start:1584 stop:1982 length:399 start_codon:yes stop_codon:yes gene_type:complete
MYTANTAQLVKEWGNWLGEEQWDYFSTYTYRYDIGVNQNYNMMQEIEKALIESSLDYKVFYVTEFSGYKTSTHNHMLIKGIGVIDIIELCLRSKGYITDKVKIEPYEKDKGANYYICKYICSEDIHYDFMIQ